MSLRFYEIIDTVTHRIMNPYTEAKLMQLGELCELKPGTRQLDLACGQGEMLCRWAKAYGIGGTGVDISSVFLGCARKRAEELDVAEQIDFVQSDASAYTIEPAAYDVVSCIGATWIGDGAIGTIEMMKPALKDPRSGLMLVGEVWWREEPTGEACEALGFKRSDYTDLAGMPGRFAEAGMALVGMVSATQEDWDFYEGLKYKRAYEWLRDNPDHPDAAAFKQWVDRTQYEYLKYERRYIGWSVFVLKPQL
jgi:SAM-dependent methyltransferase